MKQIDAVRALDFARYSTEEIRQNFLITGLVQEGRINCTYTHYDRMMIGAAAPADEPLKLETYPGLKSDYFLERREMGLLNIGGQGTVSADGQVFTLSKADCLYLGKGTKEVLFSGQGAKFILFSCPAHAAYPAQLMCADQATPVEMGSAETANHRTINKYIYPDGLKSCQLVMGYTQFKPGSVWNTMPAHVHLRRMESYFYFDLPAGQKVLHLMGEPKETRHIFIGNEEAIVSPPWSIHCGAGTASYSFIWAMAGENLDYTDQDFLKIDELR